MEEKLVHILNEMAEYLSISQMKNCRRYCSRTFLKPKHTKPRYLTQNICKCSSMPRKSKAARNAHCNIGRVTVEHLPVCSISTPVRK